MFCYFPAPGVEVDALGVEVLSDGFVDVPVPVVLVFAPVVEDSVVAASITIVGVNYHHFYKW